MRRRLPLRFPPSGAPANWQLFPIRRLPSLPYTQRSHAYAYEASLEILGPRCARIHAIACPVDPGREGGTYLGDLHRYTLAWATVCRETAAPFTYRGGRLRKVTYRHRVPTWIPYRLCFKEFSNAPPINSALFLDFNDTWCGLLLEASRIRRNRFSSSHKR